MAPVPHALVETLYRTDWGRIVATLIGVLGDFDLAEDVAQEAFAAAVAQWPETGVPAHPRAWIIQTARHKAIDRPTTRQLHSQAGGHCCGARVRHGRSARAGDR